MKTAILPLLASLLALVPHSSNAADTLLAHTEYNYDYNHFADEVNAYQQPDGERRIDYTVGKKSLTKSLHHLLTKLDPERENCLGGSYLLSLEENSVGDSLPNSPSPYSEQLTIVERVRVGSAGSNCGSEIVRTLEIQTVGGNFRIKKISAKTEDLDSDGGPTLLSRYDFLTREVEATEFEEEVMLHKAKMPKTCNLTAEQLDSIILPSLTAPLAHSLACATRAHAFNQAESTLLYSELKVAQASGVLRVACSSDGGEERNAYSVRTMDCQDPNATDRSPLSDKANNAIKSAILRDKVKMVWVKQDSAGSNRFWTGLSNVSCESPSRCWFEESQNEY
jgi:hypothetical protein